MNPNTVKEIFGITEGAKYKRSLGGSSTEVAEVVKVGRDRMGIAHVRFNVYMVRGNFPASASEQRTLAMESFVARYKERVLPN